MKEKVYHGLDIIGAFLLSIMAGCCHLLDEAITFTIASIVNVVVFLLYLYFTLLYAICDLLLVGAKWLHKRLVQKGKKKD